VEALNSKSGKKSSTNIKRKKEKGKRYEEALRIIGNTKKG
jgi:hypothetical protein